MATYHPLRLNPPDRDSIFSLETFGTRLTNMDTPFVVRVLPASGLEGAFRVHLSPESLEKLGLKVGDICQITGEDGNTGYGIAWRATDKMGNSPKLRPAKMTDTFRAAWGFKEGSHVTIAKATASVVHADKITLSDVSPSDYGNDQAAEEDGRWQTRAKFLLVECEAVAISTTFDVTTKKRLRKRFYIDHIKSTTHGNGPALFYCDDKTELVFADGSTSVEQPALPNGDITFPMLDTSKIGGLVEQVKALNAHLDYVLNLSHNNRAQFPPLGRHVVIHGYEGTGKSLLLDRVAKEARPNRAFSVRQDVTTAKTNANVQSVFEEALAAQPSVVLIDQLDELASKDNRLPSRILAEELDRLEGSSVLVIAATRSLMDVDNRLLDPGRFEKAIELPIPDLEARRQILNVLLRHEADAEDALAAVVSSRTHAFTGKDLLRLHNEARARALIRRRNRKISEDWVDVHARISMLANSSANGQVDGSVASQATTAIERGAQTEASQVTAANERATQTETSLDGEASPEPLRLTLEDFNEVLDAKIIKPSALREVFLEKPKVRWSDIGGSEAMQEHFDEIIGWPLRYPELLAENDVEPTKGVLLYGPPGCSKTMTAQAVATTYDLNFIAVKGAELISMYVGESERAVRELFRKARQAAPCVVFFDEIDSIGSEREAGAGGSKGLNVLTTLLNEMDGFEAMKDVLVLAATNKPEVLDPALLRPGRFDSHVYVGLPSAEARRQILGLSLRDSKALQHPTITDDIVSRTEGYTGAEVVLLCGVAKKLVTKKQIKGGAVPDSIVAFEEAFKIVRKGITEEMLEGYESFGNR